MRHVDVRITWRFNRHAVTGERLRNNNKIWGQGMRKNFIYSCMARTLFSISSRFTALHYRVSSKLHTILYRGNHAANPLHNITIIAQRRYVYTYSDVGSFPLLERGGKWGWGWSVGIWWIYIVFMYLEKLEDKANYLRLPAIHLTLFCADRVL